MTSPIDAQPIHRCFTVAATAYLRNLDRDDLKARCIAVHYQAPPTKTERGTSIGLRFPMLIVAGYLEDPDAVAAKVADILERHWKDEAPAEPQPPTPPSFQSEVDQWMDACFGDTIKRDQLERGDRFIEEALELAQTMPGFSADRAHALVDYVFSRPVGDRFQEVGGVMVTLAALCNAAELDIRAAAAFELARVWTKVEAIRAKQAAKPTGSALPVAVAPEAGASA